MTDIEAGPWWGAGPFWNRIEEQQEPTTSRKQWLLVLALASALAFKQQKKLGFSEVDGIFTSTHQEKSEAQQ